VKTWFQSLLFKLNLSRYAAGLKVHGLLVGEPGMGADVVGLCTLNQVDP
jgi:hypothetical protein